MARVSPSRNPARSARRVGSSGRVPRSTMARSESASASNPRGGRERDHLSRVEPDDRVAPRAPVRPYPSRRAGRARPESVTRSPASSTRSRRRVGPRRRGEHRAVAAAAQLGPHQHRCREAPAPGSLTSAPRTVISSRCASAAASGERSCPSTARALTAIPSAASATTAQAPRARRRAQTAATRSTAPATSAAPAAAWSTWPPATMPHDECRECEERSGAVHLTPSRDRAAARAWRVRCRARDRDRQAIGRARAARVRARSRPRSRARRRAARRVARPSPR